MTEGGLFAGVLGGEEEAPEREGAAEALIEAGAFAAAVAADHAKYDPGVARAAEGFLQEQTRLLKAQREEMAEQRSLRLSHLHSQSREGKIRRVGQRIRVGMQVFAALIASVIGLGLLVMLYDAFTSRSVVVNAFKAPAALAGRGLTGDVVASGVLDTLLKLQAATHSSYKRLDAKSEWASDVKIEVPETGVSLGEINRLLHQRFGHDLHIDGDLIQTELGGLALTVRGDGIPANTFSGAAGELDKLTTQAAEYVYGCSETYFFAVYLVGRGRFADALAFIPSAFAAETDDVMRGKLANAWGQAYSGMNNPSEAAGKYRLSMTLIPTSDPAHWVPWDNLISTLSATSGEEAAWKEAKAFLQAVETAPKRALPELRLFESSAGATWNIPIKLSALLQDARYNGGAGANNTIDGPQIADMYALMHDPADAARYIVSSDAADTTTKAEVELLKAYAALNDGNVAAAVLPLENFYKAWLADPVLQSAYPDNPCYLGLSYGLIGRLADAKAVFTRTGSWSRCQAFHGSVLAHAGDVNGAQRIWAEGLKVAPDLPIIYLHRGQFEMDHGDPNTAGADFAIAAGKAPHFADPLKAWGDLLAREGRWSDALAKYDEALKYAPAWTELQLARDAAARKV
jgi:hypothetical protein